MVKVVSVSVRVLSLILTIYFVNLFLGFQSLSWLEKSFADEYHLRTGHLDILQLEHNAEQFYGPPTNVLPKDLLIENNVTCAAARDPETVLYPHVLVLVKSFCVHRDRRDRIRSTWGNREALEKESIRLVFVLGRDTQKTSLEEEWKQHSDLIQINQIDYYYYSSYKLVSMLRWLDEHCLSRSRRSPHRDLRNYVLFIDDDYLLNVGVLLSYLQTLDSNPELTTYERRIFITGHRRDRTRPARFVNDRWYISSVDYPYHFYPSYVSSECFLMTRYNAHLFYLASRYTRLIPFDHIYLGLIAYSLSVDLQANNQLFDVGKPTNRSEQVICRHL